MAPQRLLSLTDEARLALDNLVDFAGDIVDPTLRLGVTGLSRSGKTVFITALVYNLVHGGRLPLLTAQTEGRIAGAQLRPQPDMDVPRFPYEERVNAMSGTDRHWPSSTNQISELRLVLEFRSNRFLSRRLSPGTLTLDIVDYPGEWLLDLPLLGKSYETWCRETMALSQTPIRAKLAARWKDFLATLDNAAPADETIAREGADIFTDYLRASRDDKVALSTLPPGRFLMPGDLAGSPALTFFPLAIDAEGTPPKDSLWAMMRDRYEAYKAVVVKPFFRDHFARLDRQIVLVDMLTALNAGPNAVRDLERALSDILTCFRPGARSWFPSPFARRIDRILFAATKADHLHHASHDRLESILARLVHDARDRASFSGARIDVTALAAIRATREDSVSRNGESLDVVVGTPEKGEKIGKSKFDGKREFALFPGDLPEKPESLFEPNASPYRALESLSDENDAELRFVRFRPPDFSALATDSTGRPILPHIRLDSALEFLIGDRLA